MTIDPHKLLLAADDLNTNYLWQVILADLRQQRDKALAAYTNTGYTPEHLATFKALSEIAGYPLECLGQPETILNRILRQHKLPTVTEAPA